MAARACRYRRSSPWLQQSHAQVLDQPTGPGGEEGRQLRKTFGHRHTVEAVIHWLSGYGHSIIDGIRYDWKPGDFICVPMFAWHRHINESDELALYVASTTGPLSMGLGRAVYEDERYPQYFVFAQQGEERLRALRPGGVGSVSESGKEAHLSQTQNLYAEQLLFAVQEGPSPQEQGAHQSRGREV